MIKIIIVLFSFQVFLIGCCINEPFENVQTGDIIKSSYQLDIDLMNCLQVGDEIVLRNKLDFELFISNMRENGCEFGDTNFINEADFSKYSILGKICTTKACNPYFVRDVKFLKNKKKVLYKISTGSCGFCDGHEIGSANIVLVSPIPDNYSVEFVIDI